MANRMQPDGPHAHDWARVWTDGNSQLQQCKTCPGRRLVGIDARHMPPPPPHPWQERWLRGERELPDDGARATA